MPELPEMQALAERLDARPRRPHARGRRPAGLHRAEDGGTGTGGPRRPHGRRCRTAGQVPGGHLRRRGPRAGAPLPGRAARRRVAGQVHPAEGERGPPALRRRLRGARPRARHPAQGRLVDLRARRRRPAGPARSRARRGGVRRIPPDERLAASDPHGAAGPAHPRRPGTGLRRRRPQRGGLSPFAPVRSLTAEQRSALVAAVRSVLAEALDQERQRTGGLSEPRLGRRFAVHNRFGQPCPRCGRPLLRVSYESYEIVYCAPCQTGGRTLADRRLSRLLR